MLKKVKIEISSKNVLNISYFAFLSLTDFDTPVCGGRLYKRKFSKKDFPILGAGEENRECIHLILFCCYCCGVWKR